MTLTMRRSLVSMACLVAVVAGFAGVLIARGGRDQEVAGDDTDDRTLVTAAV